MISFFPPFFSPSTIFTPHWQCRQVKGRACAKSPGLLNSLPRTHTHPSPAVIYIIYVPACRLRGAFTPWLRIYIYKVTRGDEHGTGGDDGINPMASAWENRKPELR